MERLSTCDLREKEVINLCDGSRIGYPGDFEFDVADGRITAIVISRPSGFLGLGRGRELIVPWNRIECIGTDAILVKLSTEDLRLPEREVPRQRRYF